MVAPIKSVRFEDSLKSLKGNEWYSRYVFSDSGTRYSQSKPIDRPLPYKRQLVIEESATRFGRGLEIPDVTFDHGMSSRESNLAYSRAYSKFIDLIKPQSAELGITLAQLDMTAKLLRHHVEGFVFMQKLSGIAKVLDRFAIELRGAAATSNRRKRQRYRNRAARVLGCRPTSDREVRRKMDEQLLKTGATSFSAEYLAFHYGWSPFLKDLHDTAWTLAGLDLINEDEPIFVQAGGTAHFRGNHRTFNKSYVSKYAVKLGAIAKIENKPAYILNIMGLANPALIAWDAAKFSFVADWFGNFSQVLAAPMNTFGVSFSQMYRTDYISFAYTYRGGDPARGFVQSVRGFDVERQLISYLQWPKLVLKNPIGRDWGKAFAQIALLTQFGLKPSSRK